MAHPSKLLDRLRAIYTDREIGHWVYGIFNTSYEEPASGTKGILAAVGSELVFLGKDALSSDRLTVIPIAHVRHIAAETAGPLQIVCETDKGTAEMALISRGDAAGFVSYVKTYSAIQAS